MRQTLLLIILAFYAQATLIGTGKKLPSDTLLISNYYIDFQSDILKDDNEKTLIDDYGWHERTYLFKPVYYKDNFQYSITIPYTKRQRELSEEEIQGILDISIGLGYFIPNNFGDLLLLSSVQFPTAKYEKDKPKVYYGTTPALQLGLNRYELKEDLYFFKPVLNTKVPFLIDSTLSYHYRGKDLDTKVKNGYYIGAELTISAILSKNLFMGPAIYYKRYNRDGTYLNMGSSKFQVGADALYRFNDKNSLCIEYVEDTHVDNRAKGDRWIARYVHIF